MKRIKVYMSEADMLRDHLREAGRKIGRYRRWIKRWLAGRTNVGSDGIRVQRVPEWELHRAIVDRPVPRKVQS